ncbi:hypothetical protein [Streptomyces sp. AC512_CC834]|uniref:hypothetical protein n=1 Tax=Streptomyces sp. AC512_CC834 TaxID=2823691 RepID=UPI001C270A07|nr:hypothetical protein [Streptomyces sp. AC512_CC834]
MNVELDCAIYIAAPNWDIVSHRLLHCIPEALLEGDVIHFPSLVVEWQRNDYEGTVESEDDFIGWPSVLDCQPTDSASLGEVVPVASEILGALWEVRIRAVAACDYEHLLPRKGGTIP